MRDRPTSGSTEAQGGGGKGKDLARCPRNVVGVSRVSRSRVATQRRYFVDESRIVNVAELCV